MGSIDDNTSGGSYAYRTSKAAVNMVGRSLACDLKERGIAVSLIAPGFVVSSFGPGEKAMKKMGARAVEPSVLGVVQAIDAMTAGPTKSSAERGLMRPEAMACSIAVLVRSLSEGRLD
mgnify:CR=1 FL=1